MTRPLALVAFIAAWLVVAAITVATAGPAIPSFLPAPERSLP